MKITQAEAFHIAMPFEHAAPPPLQGSGVVRKALEAVYVRVDTDTGLSGWGECFGFACSPVTHFAIGSVLRPMLAGRVVRRTRRLSFVVAQCFSSAG